MAIRCKIPGNKEGKFKEKKKPKIVIPSPLGPSVDRGGRKKLLQSLFDKPVKRGK